MGKCCSAPDNDIGTNNNYDDQLGRWREEDEMAHRRVFKLLLLGAGESGKSTIFKQMKILYGRDESGRKLNPYDDAERRKDYIFVVARNIFKNMWALVKAADTLSIEIEDQEAAQDFRDLDARNTIIVPRVAVIITKLWKDKGIQAVYHKRSLLQIADSTEYFFENVDRIAQKSYIPPVLVQ